MIKYVSSLSWQMHVSSKIKWAQLCYFKREMKGFDMHSMWATSELSENEHTFCSLCDRACDGDL